MIDSNYNETYMEGRRCDITYQPFLFLALFNLINDYTINRDFG